MPGPCPTPERLAAALRDRQSPVEDVELAAHLSECPACQAQLEALAGGSGWLEAEARRETERSSPDSEPLEEAMRALEEPVESRLVRQTRPSPQLNFLEPSDEPGVLGRFGAYEVLEQVAGGGMGIVLKARDPVLDRVVALKILPPTLAANALARARFVREGRAAAAVVHEHVVPIFAVDECAGLPYIVMQFVHGRPLSERIRVTGPLRLEEILRIGAQTAAGLAAAHAQGLVHRDIKPGNILLENAIERVKLTDFGLARAADDAGLTRTGELAGTPEFMAPEQANNEAVDHRADLFSLGSVLYAMGTGCSPFQADSVVAVLRRVCDAEPPPMHEVNPSVPRWLSDIVARLMAKTPASRIQSARELGELLERYLARVQRGELGELSETAAARAQAAARAWWRRIALGAAASAGVALVFFAFKDWPFANGTSTLPTGSAVFVVRDPSGNTVGSYANADEALRASPPSGVVELDWNGPRQIPPLHLGRKPLTLRAGAGFHPVWRYAGMGSAGIQTEAALSLENLEFEFVSAQAPGPGLEREPEAAVPPRGGMPAGPPRAREVSDEGETFVSVTKAPLRVSHCFFWRQVAPRPIMEQSTFIVLDHSPECVLRDSAFNAILGQCVVWRRALNAQAREPGVMVAGGISLVLSNTALFGLTSILLDLADAAPARLELSRCTIRGREAFGLNFGFAATNLSVSASRNVISTGSLIDDLRATPQWLSQSLHWNGRENLFSIDHGFVRTSNPQFEVPASLAAWANQWGAKPSNSRKVKVTFEVQYLRRATLSGGSHGLDVFRITDIHPSEGPPFPREQWPHVGADTRSLGPLGL